MSTGIEDRAPAGGAPGADITAGPMDRIDIAELKRKSIRGGMFTFLSQGASLLVQFASTVVLARLLSPDDYGLVAMVLAVTAFAALFSDMGLSSATIQKKALTPAQQSNLFWVNVCVGLALTLSLALASPLVAWFYERPEVRWVTVALSGRFVIGSLSSQSAATLARQMRFGRQALAAVSGGIANLSVAVLVALAGYGFWALVWGQLAAVITSSILLFFLSPFRPSLPSRGTNLREMVRFGANITAFDFVNYFHRNLDNVLIGRVWGSEALGLYSRAYSLLMLPISNIRGPIQAVAFPAMSRLQNEPDAFRAYYCRITAGLAFLSMPLTAFLAVSSGPVIEIALGRRWIGVVPIFTVLAVTAFIQPAASLRGLVLLGMARGSRYLTWGIVNALAVTAGFVCGLPWGALGVAASYAIVNYAILYPSLVFSFKDTPVRAADFFVATARPAAASVAAAALTYVRNAAFPGGSALSVLFQSLVCFCAIYGVAVFLLPGGRQEYRYYRALAGEVLPGRRLS